MDKVQISSANIDIYTLSLEHVFSGLNIDVPTSRVIQDLTIFSEGDPVFPALAPALSLLNTTPDFIGNHKITKVGTTHPAVDIYGAATNVVIEFFDITGGRYGVQVRADAIVVVDSSTIQLALSAGVRAIEGSVITVSNTTILNSTINGITLGVVNNQSLAPSFAQITGNTIMNNGSNGISISGVGGSPVISGNIIRGNTGSGIFVDNTQTVPLRIENNLIVENSLIASGAVHLDAPLFGSGAAVDLYGNTIAHNTGLGVGLQADLYSTLNMFDNAIALNANGDVSISTAALAEDYNIIGDVQLSGLNDVYADPLFINQWYLSSGPPDGVSPALNVDATRTPLIDTYTEIGNVDIGNLDLGYHHTSAPAFTKEASATQSTVSGINPPSVWSTTPLNVDPIDIFGVNLGTGQTVAAEFVYGSLRGESIGGTVDNGDGTYTITVNNGAATGTTTNSVRVFVNGTPLKALKAYSVGMP